jgi:hypothetical protein
MLLWDNISPDAKYQDYVTAAGIDGASDFPRFLRKSGAMLGCPPAVLTRAEDQQPCQDSSRRVCLHDLPCSVPTSSLVHVDSSTQNASLAAAILAPGSSLPLPLAWPWGSPLDLPPLSRLHAALRMDQRLAQCAVASLSWMPPTCLG